jgi:hypothetical protein
VVPKPGKAADHLEAMRDYILEYHPNDTGIIYCFTTKVFFCLKRECLEVYILLQDTEQVAQKLKEVSNGKIKTGVYHAKIADSEKENLHKAWRSGTIKVVCATIGILFVFFTTKQTYALMVFSFWPWNRQRRCAVCTPPLGKRLPCTAFFSHGLR